MPQGLELPIEPALEWPKQGNARVPYRVFADPEIYRAELDRVFLGPSWQYLGARRRTARARRLQDDLSRRDAGHRHPRRGRRDPRDGQPLRPSRQPRLPEAARPHQGRADLRLSRLALRPRRQSDQRRVPPRRRRQGRHARELPPRRARPEEAAHRPVRRAGVRHAVAGGPAARRLYRQSDRRRGSAG